MEVATHKKTTKDGGHYEEALGNARVLQTIDAKLKVLGYYEELLRDKARANEVLCAPRREAKSREARLAMEASRDHAKKIKARNSQKMCYDKFPLTVAKSQVCKWRVTARKEAWRELPELLRQRVTQTNNAWRLRLGLKSRGRRAGGTYPMELQRELDLLVFEHVNGLSEISERKEVVTLEHVAAWRICTRQVPC